jgi:hypothetical protein
LTRFAGCYRVLVPFFCGNISSAAYSRCADSGPANYLRFVWTMPSRSYSGSMKPQTEKGAARAGETKTSRSNACVSISDDLYKEVALWLRLSTPQLGDSYHRSPTLASNDLLFPARSWHSVSDRQLLETDLEADCGQGLYSRHDLPGSVSNVCNQVSAPWIAKRCPGQLRHSKARDDRVVKARDPESVRNAVAGPGRGICQATESNSAGIDIRRPH